MPDQRKLAFEIPVSTRLPEDLVAEVDNWSENDFRTRSMTLSAILRTVLEQVKSQGGFQQSLSQVLGRLKLDPA